MKLLTIVLLTILCSPAGLPCTQARVQTKAHRVIHASNLKQIGQAALIYANNNDGRFPEVKDIWDYSAALAQNVGLDVPSFWQSAYDPASDELPTPRASFFIGPKDDPTKRRLDPAIRTLKPSYTVVVSGITTALPATTPIAWTRGLQSDGAWSDHAPYGNRGGYILFLGGNVQFFRDLRAPDNQLARFDGNGVTSNILAALPPNARISEYQPTPEEQKKWAASNARERVAEYVSDSTPLVLIAVLWGPFITLSAYRLKTHRPYAFRILIWPALITFLAAIIVPTC